MTFIKICGLKEVSDVQAAVENGANFIGFVFAPSKRQISLEEAQLLAQHIPPHVKKVGVFVNESKEKITALYNQVPLDYVQYHGDESSDFIDEVGLPSIKAFSVDETTDFHKIEHYKTDYYLFDAPGIQYRGGSGHTFNWGYLEKAKIDRSKMILAGGLTPQNVADGIKQLAPFAVDVSSSVETDGKKDATKITAFIHAVKEVQA